MTISFRNVILAAVVASLYIMVGALDWGIFPGSWNTALTMLNFALIGAIMALGVNRNGGLLACSTSGSWGSSHWVAWPLC